jgi:hypothetical protein
MGEANTMEMWYNQPSLRKRTNAMFRKLRIFVFESPLVNALLRILPDKQFILLNYFVVNGRFPDLNHPDTYTEKIQWIKIYGGLEKCTKYVDKYTVREYVKKTVGEKYLIPLLGVWDSFDEIPFDQFPKMFILKSTQGSGYTYICKDKDKLDKKALRTVVNTWLHDDFYRRTREVQYKNAKPRIICEEYLDAGPGGITDFKFFCKNGEPQLIDVIGNRLVQMVMDTYDLNFVKLPEFSTHPEIKRDIKKPSNLQEMIEVARKLAKPFPFVRVDLYSHNNHVYFGELTFTPGNGMGEFDSRAANQRLGEVIDISAFTNK